MVSHGDSEAGAGLIDEGGCLWDSLLRPIVILFGIVIYDNCQRGVGGARFSHSYR